MAWWLAITPEAQWMAWRGTKDPFSLVVFGWLTTISCKARSTKRVRFSSTCSRCATTSAFWRKNMMPKNIDSWEIFRRRSLTSHSSTVLTTSAPASTPDRPTTAAKLNRCPCRSDVRSLRWPYMKNRADLVWATLGEGGLVLALATIGWATNQPLIFASLGPTAYELVEQPRMPSARPYNVIVGHLIGVGAGFLALYMFNAWAAPNVLATGVVSPHRLWATAISAALTTIVCLALKAGQPAALATTLLISLGAMQTRRDAIAIIVGVLLVTAMGEPVRRLRLKRSGATIADQPE